MPAKNRVKLYVENGYYHLFNRGVEKRNIFVDDRDYRVLLHFLKLYLSPPLPLPKLTGADLVIRKRPRFVKSLYNEIKLLAYCLMPNHFHLLVKQKTPKAITQLIRRVCTSYVIYFNQRYERVGPLFQGRYKAVLVDTDEQLLHLSRYIHINPHELPTVTRTDLVNYPYSSYKQYLGEYKTQWLYPEEILTFFRSAQQTSPKDILSYQSFVEDFIDEPKGMLKNLTLE